MKGVIPLSKARVQTGDSYGLSVDPLGCVIYNLGEGRYRDLLAWIEARTCGGCGQKTECLCSDSSDDEYGPVPICRECISAMFSNKFGRKGK